MAAKVKVLIDKKAFSEEVLKSEGLRQLVETAANQIAEAAGEEYEATVTTGSKRVSAKVKPASAHAYYSNRKHNTLLKAMGRVKV